MTVIFIHPDLPDPAGIDFSHPGHDRSDDFAVLADQFSVDLDVIVFYLKVLLIKAFIELVAYEFGIFFRPVQQFIFYWFGLSLGLVFIQAFGSSTTILQFACIMFGFT